MWLGNNRVNVQLNRFTKRKKTIEKSFRKLLFWLAHDFPAYVQKNATTLRDLQSGAEKCHAIFKNFQHFNDWDLVLEFALLSRFVIFENNDKQISGFFL